MSGSGPRREMAVILHRLHSILHSRLHGVDGEIVQRGLSHAVKVRKTSVMSRIKARHMEYGGRIPHNLKQSVKLSFKKPTLMVAVTDSFMAFNVQDGESIPPSPRQWGPVTTWGQCLCPRPQHNTVTAVSLSAS